MKSVEAAIAGGGRALRVVFSDGDVFVLKDVYQVDAGVYGKQGLYSGTVVNVDFVGEHRRRLFKVGAGLDFRIGDVSEIRDAESGAVVYQREINGN